MMNGVMKWSDGEDFQSFHHHHLRYCVCVSLLSDDDG